ncbi:MULTISPECIES: tyrosine-type recombinase/integrase [unclassified Sphingobium]|uniref:tyrosine-type recombinase/integrase n=1 Tax=unclassified Sphingobium TaxID=2611147 RepID=UPI0035A6C368
MQAIVLTDAKIQGMKPPASGQAEVSDGKVPGLRLRIGTSGAKTFIVRKRIGGRIRNITIGRYGPRFGLAEARKKARTVLNDIEAGQDPTTTLATPRRGGKGAETVRGMWPAYKAAKANLRSIGEVERIFDKYILPTIGDRMADAITRGDVTRLIDDIAADAPVMARAVHSQLSAFYSWALPRLDRLPSNPCRDAGRPGKPKSRDRVLSAEELRALWQVADAQPSPWGPSIKLLILTGARRSEVFEAEWSEFDIKGKVWTIPADRAKNGQPHAIPLSRDAIEVVKAVPKIAGSDKLFPASGNPDNAASGISKAVNRLRAAVAVKLKREVADWSLHDIRRSVATNMQRLGIRLEVTEAVLNHVSGSRAGIVGVYQRHDFAAEKRHALDKWAGELADIVKGKVRGNVVALHG